MPPINRWLLIMVLVTWHSIAHSIQLPADAKLSTHPPLAGQVAVHTANTSTSPISAADNRPIKSPSDKSLRSAESHPDSPANQPHDNRLAHRLDKSPDKSAESSTLSPSDRQASSNLFLPSSVRAEIPSINNSNESLSNKAIINSSFARANQTAEANSSFEASHRTLPDSSSTKPAKSTSVASSSATSTSTSSGAPISKPGDGSKNLKSIPPSGAQRLQFEQIHGGFLLINPISTNVSSKINRTESTTSDHIENKASLGDSQQPADRSTSLKVSLDAELSSASSRSNASLIDAHKSANDRMKSESASLQNAAKASSLKDSLKSSHDVRQGTSDVKPTSTPDNDDVPFQATTKEPKVSSSSTSKLSTKQPATMEPTQSSNSTTGSSMESKHKQINQLNTLIETSSNHRATNESDRSTASVVNSVSASAEQKINHFDSGHVNFPATNHSGSAETVPAMPNSVSNELNSFKSASVKKDTKQQQIDYETTSVNIENPEEDKLCFAENGWPTTECSESAVSNCSFPYSGLTYRLCYSSCQWSKVDTSQCKLGSLAEIHNLILYHVHKHLIDGLYPLADELAKVICSSSSPILSPIDRIDAFDALNAIFNSAALNVHFDTQEPEQRERELCFVKSILKVADALVTNQIVFETETEKNSLITFKTTETLLGLRRLLENVCRALIVQNEQNSVMDIEEVRQVPLLGVGQGSNLALMLIHRTHAGKLLTLFSNEPQLPGANRLPHTALHLEELKNRDAGIAILSVNNLRKGGYTQSGKWKILANPLLVTIVPAISIAADFEQTPTVNVEFTFLDHFVPFAQPVYCVRLANASKNSWTRSKCVLVRRNATSAQCACSVMGYLTVVASRGSGQLGRSESDAFGNYHQSYASKLHKTLFISSAACSLVIVFIIAFSLLSNLLRNWRSARRPATIGDELERTAQSIKDPSKWHDAPLNERTAFNLSEGRQSVPDNQLHLLSQLNAGKQFYRGRAYNPLYCSQTQLNWLLLIGLFAVIQLFWLSGVLFPGDQFTIFRLWNALVTRYRGQSQLKPIFISSSWSLNLQSQASHLINFMDGQQFCLNVALVLHFLFTSCALLMLLNTLHLYRHLRKCKLNDLKFDSLFNYSTRPFPFNCCSFNYARSTESLISKANCAFAAQENGDGGGNGGGNAESSVDTGSSENNNQISSIEQLVEELNQRDLSDGKDLSSRKQSTESRDDNLINSQKRKATSPISCSPSKLPKKTQRLSRRALGQKVAYLLAQTRTYSRHLHTFACYCLCALTAALITVLTYKLNPAGYETRRYCWMSIEGGITYSFIVPVSSLIVLNTVLILLALRQFLHLKRVHQQARSAYDSPLEGELVNSDHPQYRCINKMCKFNFIFRSTYFNINLLVCTLPAFAVYWCFSVLALEQMQTSAFQFIFALLNFLFSCCLLLLNLPYVKDTVLHRDYYFPSAITGDQLIGEELAHDDDLMEEELIIYVECADDENQE